MGFNEDQKIFLVFCDSRWIINQKVNVARKDIIGIIDEIRIWTMDCRLGKSLV